MCCSPTSHHVGSQSMVPPGIGQICNNCFPVGQTKQEDDSSQSEGMLVAESLRTMKNSRPRGMLGVGSAFSPFTAVVPRPCARGDTTAGDRADTLGQVGTNT